MKPHRSSSIFVFFLLFLFLGFRYGQAQNFPPNTTVYAIAKSGLNIRNKPALEGSKVGRIPFGERLELLETVLEAKEQFEGIFGYWVKVQFDSISGYVFDGFLSRIPVLEPLEDKDKYGCLTVNLKKYIISNYNTVDSSEYSNYRDGESTHSMKIFNLNNGHKYIDHFGWESWTTELQLSNILKREGDFLFESLVEVCKLNGGQSIGSNKYMRWINFDHGESISIIKYEEGLGVYVINVNGGT